MFDAEDIAQKFHEVQERLAPKYKNSRRTEPVAWQSMKECDKKLLIATVQYLIDSGFLKFGAIE